MAKQGMGANWQLSTSGSCEWAQRVIALLEMAVGELNRDHSAKDTILKAASLLREQSNSQAAAGATNETGRLLAWQARKVREYVDIHIAGPIRVADLCALIERSESHFSRVFKHTFGTSPHVFVIHRRVQLAAQYMLQTDAYLSDIALRCGFTDQAHLSRHFRQTTGETPAAWRRARRIPDTASSSSNEGMARELNRVNRPRTLADSTAVTKMPFRYHRLVTTLGAPTGKLIPVANHFGDSDLNPPVLPSHY
jgi:AraC family transcriptional regulator